MSKHMEFYIQDDAASIQIGKNVYRRVSIPIDDFNAACDHYGFVKERTCRIEGRYGNQYCTCCGEMVGTWDSTSELYIDGNMVELWNYCPNCGAKVVGE